jgi:hypothetical protein
MFSLLRPSGLPYNHDTEFREDLLLGCRRVISPTERFIIADIRMVSGSIS